MAPKSLLSICIPTFNRADLLQETLCHLEATLDPSYEIVVSNNCSEDHTLEVLKEFELRWGNLKSVSLNKNIHMLRNVDMAYRLATSKYIYCLSDDDRINYNGIMNAVNLLEENEDIMGVFGNYQEWEKESNTTTDINLIKENQTFSKENKIDIIQAFDLLWFPVMRQEFYQRHCDTDPHQFGMWSLVGNMLDHGNVTVITDIFYKHAHTIPRMEHQLTESWYHDMHRAQYEVYIGDMGSGEASNAQFISNRATQAYTQGLRFSLLKNDFGSARFFLRRCRAYGILNDSTIQITERQIMNGLIAQQISDLISPLPNIKLIAIEKHDGFEEFEQILKESIKNIEIMRCELDNIIDDLEEDSVFYLFWDINTLKKSKIFSEKSDFYHATFIDIFNRNKITDWAIKDRIPNDAPELIIPN